MICRNAKNCVRMTGLVAGITFGAVRTAAGSCGGCRADANGGQESDKSIAVRHSFVKSRESSLCGPEPPPAEARKRAPQAPPRKFLRIRRSAGTDFARGNNCRIRHSAGCRFGPGIFSNPCSIQEFMRTQPRPLYSKSDGRNPCCPICRILGSYSAKSARGSWSMLLICTISIPFGRFPLAR